MDSESSSKFIGSLTKFLQSLCNGYVEFDDGVELIGHLYLSVDAGKSGKTLNYFLNEKVCKNDNSVTFISNSFHAQPEAKLKAALNKENEYRKDDGDLSDSGDSVSKNTSSGTVLSRVQQSLHSAASPNQNRSSMQTGTKRPGSPLKGPTLAQKRAATPPTSRRLQTAATKGSGGSPASKTVPSSPSSSSQDNIPSPSPARKSRNETSQPTSNQLENTSVDNESDIVPPNILSINPPAEFASFLGSLASDNQTSQDQSSPPDTKPDTDVTFIKEEFVSEPSSCAQAGSSGQRSGRAGEDSSGLYPVMLHQNTSVFPSTSAGYLPGYQGGASATATSQHPGFPGSSTSQSDPFSPVPGTSQDGADPSVFREHLPFSMHRNLAGGRPTAVLRPGSKDLSQGLMEKRHECCYCEKSFQFRNDYLGHLNSKHFNRRPYMCNFCDKSFPYSQSLRRHMLMLHKERNMST